MQIWKFPIELGDGHIEVSAPNGSKPIHVGIDPKTGAICLWAIVELKSSQRKLLKIRVYGTGQTLDPTTDAKNHIGTVITPDGFVWHFFKEN